MNPATRRSSTSTRRGRSAAQRDVAADANEMAVAVAVPGSNGHGAPLALSAAVSGRDVEVEVLPSVAPDEDRSLQHPHNRAGGVVAEQALRRALRYVPRTSVMVVGSRADGVVKWLRDGGRHAERAHICFDVETPERHIPQSTKATVIVAADLAEAPADSPGFFAAIRRQLTADGLFIAVVPNLTHAATRIEMLFGRYSARSNGGRSSFAIADVERLFEDARFTIIDIERQIDGVDVLKTLGEGVPEPVLSMLATDLDAMTSHFVIVAESESSSSVSRCHRRVRESVDEHRSAVQAVERLDSRVAELEVRVQHWGAEIDRAALDGATQPVLGRTATDERHERDVQAMVEHRALDRAREAERDAVLNQARESLLKRTADLKALTGRVEQIRYRGEVLRTRQAVRREVPRGSVVTVISRGDDELLAFDGRVGWHFPRTDEGTYAGHHPADSQAAIRHVEELRGRGARYLVIPRTAFWWLEHYREFNEYLHRRCRCVWREDRTCVLFELRGKQTRR